MNQPTQEQWRPVPGCDGLYYASNLGRIKRIAYSRENRLGHLVAYRERILRQVDNGHGYYTVNTDAAKHLLGSRQYVHRMVLAAFKGPCPEGQEARHINGDRADNRPENLEWGTHVENHWDKRRHKMDHYADRDRCSRGHLYTAENTRWYEYPNDYTADGRHVQMRVCRICERMNHKPRPKQSKPPRTHCKHGHDITGDNGLPKQRKFRRKDGSTGITNTVECRECNREHSRRAEAKRKAKRNSN